MLFRSYYTETEYAVNNVYNSNFINVTYSCDDHEEWIEEVSNYFYIPVINKIVKYDMHGITVNSVDFHDSVIYINNKKYEVTDRQVCNS